jgi:hypothetical protein
MVDANREYKKAIEVISTELIHLSECTGDMDVLYRAFSTPDNAFDGYGFDADLNIRKEVNLYNEIDALNSIFKLQTEAITQRIMNFSNNFTLIFKTCSDFRQIIDTIRLQLHTQSGDEASSIVVQMSEVAGELLKNLGGIKLVLDENAEAASALRKKYNVEYLGNNYEIIQKLEVRTLSNAFRELNYLNREVLQVLNTKMKSILILSNLRESMESVCYYKHFESEITQIIRSLDEISDRMKAGDERFEVDDKDTVNSRYKQNSMESEHGIHNSAIRNKKTTAGELFKETLHSVQNEDGDTAVIFE